jgi:hypothetical protein
VPASFSYITEELLNDNGISINELNGMTVAHSNSKVHEVAVDVKKFSIIYGVQKPVLPKVREFGAF